MLVTSRQRRSAAALAAVALRCHGSCPSSRTRWVQSTTNGSKHAGDAHVAVDAIVGYLTTLGRRGADAARHRRPSLVERRHPRRAASPGANSGGAPACGGDRSRHAPGAGRHAPHLRLGAHAVRLEAVPLQAFGGEVAQLLDELGHHADPALVLAETGGNPLFVTELARDKAPFGGSLTAPSWRGDTADSTATTSRCSTSPPCSEPSSTPSCWPQQPAGRSMPSSSRSSARAAGLTRRAERPGRFALVHVVSHRATTPSVRHVACAFIERSPTSSRDADDRTPTELARHACLAAPLGKSAEAIDHVPSGGSRRARLLGAAADLYELAVVTADAVQPPDTGRRLDLLIRLGESLHRRGDPRHRASRGAADEARRIDDTTALGRSPQR